MSRHTSDHHSVLCAASKWIVVMLFLGATSNVSAHDEMYYPASFCKPNVDGRFASDVDFNFGTAHNRHNTDHRWLDCPIPYRRLSNPQSVDVRAVVYDGASDASVRVRICDTPNSFYSNVSCTPWVSSGTSTVAEVLLQVSYSPSSATRWVSLQVELPDIDTQTGYSFLRGYRVCRGGFSGC